MEEKAVHTATEVVNKDSGSSKELIYLAFPLIISFISQSVMGIVDVMIIGHVGTAEQSGVGLGAGLVWSFEAIFAGTISVVTTFVAQNYGAGKINELKKWVTAAMYFIIPVSALLIASSLAIPWLMELTRTNTATRPHAVLYLTYMLYASPFFLICFAFTSFFRGIGDNVTPMAVSIIANIINVIICFLLVFGWFGLPAMGVKGVALATFISMGISVILFCFRYFSANNNRLFGTRQWPRVDNSELLDFIKIGFPIGISWFLENLAFNIMTLYIATYDPASLAANTIVFQLTSFSFFPAVALSIATSTLVGQYLGAKRKDLAMLTAGKSILFSCVFMGTLGLIFFIFSRQFIYTFNGDPEVVALGSIALCLAAVYQIFDALGITVDGVFRGAGYTTFPMIVRLVVMWGVFVPLIFVLGNYMNSGIKGGWTAALIGIFLQGSVMLIAYKKIKWADKILVKD